jgi:hypothetical protein
LEIPSLSREPLEAEMTAYHGFGYRRLGTAGFRLQAKAGTSLTIRQSIEDRIT